MKWFASIKSVSTDSLFIPIPCGINPTPELCSTHFRTRGEFRVSREIVGDLFKPRGFARYEEVAFGPYAWVIIETAESDAEFRDALGAVYNR